MKTCDLLTATTSYDAYHKPTTTYNHSKYIEAFITVRAGSTASNNSLIATTSTHYALTTTKGITTANRLSYDGTTYIIDFVIDDTPLSQLFLKVQ